MTPRYELKAKAKSVLRPNYWMIVLVSFILLLVSGGGSSINSGREVASESIHYSAGDSNFMDDADSPFHFDMTTEEGMISSAVTNLGVLLLKSVPLTLFVSFGIVMAALGFCLNVLLLNPLIVGCQRFFLVSQHFPAKLRELTYAFDTNYWNAVITMLLRAVKIFLWSLLLVIPGIIKTYEYRLVPYLLAEHPDMSRGEIFAASSHLMWGNKWRAFVLDLSFILWDLLSAVTLGVAGVLYVNPYRNLTNAAFYEAVCREKQS